MTGWPETPMAAYVIQMRNIQEEMAEHVQVNYQKVQQRQKTYVLQPASSGRGEDWC